MGCICFSFQSEVFTANLGIIVAFLLGLSEWQNGPAPPASTAGLFKFSRCMKLPITVLMTGHGCFLNCAGRVHSNQSGGSNKDTGTTAAHDPFKRLLLALLITLRTANSFPGF